MTLAAASLGVDSLIVGGVDSEAIAQLYGYDSGDYTCFLVVLFGYRAAPEQPTRVRKTTEEVVDSSRVR